ncbi:hypothetical protein MSPP1_003558 [Malassezia sp. CBS 17886]|nr:hypothetical protein MSPP1_003558 [Malassezia sp. CBS 17886]
MSTNASRVAERIAANEKELVDDLAAAVAIPSVSGDAAYRKDVIAMGNWLKDKFGALGADVATYPLGTQMLDGKPVELPPVVVGTVGRDAAKKTVLIYGHYDVQPALKSDGWDSEPFTLVNDAKTGRLYGRGSTDDKGPVLGWMHVVKAHRDLGIEMPVNLKFCLEGMEESGSVGLDEFVLREKDNLFRGVDAMCISDNYWLGTKKPCVTHGLRGVAYFKLTVSGPARDLHSGVFGGVVHEPMTDLVKVMASLVTPQGEITIPGIPEQVAPLTDAERRVYDVMEFGIGDIDNATGSSTAISNDKQEALMRRMRYPSLSLHGIEGAFAEAGSKTVIPSKVVGKFSIRLVPDMEPEKVMAAVERKVKSEFAQLHSKNHMSMEQDHPGKPWIADPNHWNYEAAIRATEKVYGVRPDLTREGGSIPITLTFADALDLSNYIKGTQLLGTYLYEVAAAADTA